MNDILTIYTKGIEQPILISYNKIDKITKLGGKKFYLNNGIIRVYFEGNKMTLAKYLLDIKDKNLEADHIDHDQFNNTDENLRTVNKWQSIANREKPDSYGKLECTSKYKGVVYVRIYGKGKHWRAYITINNKFISLGYFETEKEAALAYNKKALELFGEYACLNTI